MKTSRMEKVYCRLPSVENKIKYKKQKNYTKRLCRREKKNFIKKLDLAKLDENRKFWETLKPFFSDKGNGQENITLIEEDEIVTDSKRIADIFNKYFKDAVDQLGPFNNDDVFTVVGEDITDKIQRITEKFKNHPSIRKIKENSEDTPLFKFREIDSECMVTEIKKT